MDGRLKIALCLVCLCTCREPEAHITIQGLPPIPQPSDQPGVIFRAHQYAPVGLPGVQVNPICIQAVEGIT